MPATTCGARARAVGVVETLCRHQPLDGGPKIAPVIVSTIFACRVAQNDGEHDP
jgi:hypothetical protein